MIQLSGMGRCFEVNSADICSRTIEKHSRINELSADTSGWTKNTSRAMLWLQTQWSLIRGRIMPCVSLDWSSSRCLGSAHFAWSIPSSDDTRSFNEVILSSICHSGVDQVQPEIPSESIMLLSCLPMVIGSAAINSKISKTDPLQTLLVSSERQITEALLQPIFQVPVLGNCI